MMTTSRVWIAQEGPPAGHRCPWPASEVRQGGRWRCPDCSTDWQLREVRGWNGPLPADLRTGVS
jgi:hypothetical protein